MKVLKPFLIGEKRIDKELTHCEWFFLYSNNLLPELVKKGYLEYDKQLLPSTAKVTLL
jgi:hypothetical protein